MTDTTTEPQTLEQLAAPLLKSTATYYGVPVCPIGEESEVVIVGWHDDRHLIAAANAYARKFIGEKNLASLVGDFEFGPDDLLAEMKRTHASFVDHCGNHGEGVNEPACPDCQSIREGDWWLNWNQKPETPGAFPVTVWDPS